MVIKGFQKSLTPDKSRIAVTITKWGGTKRVAFINKKGTFKYRNQCATCKFRGKVQAGLGYHVNPTCDRDGETWRLMSGSTNKNCKFWESEQNDENT